MSEVKELVIPYQRRERRQEAWKEANPEAPTPEDEEVVEQKGTVKAPKGENKQEDPFEKRYKDLRSFSDKKINELVAEKNALLEKLAMQQKEQSVELPATEEEVADFAKKYPDFWRIMTTTVTKATTEKVSKTEEQLKDLLESKRKVEQKEAYLKIVEAHPDFAEIGEDDAFTEFLEEKPRYQSLFYEYSTDWESSIDALDLYKAWKNKKYPPADTKKPRKETRKEDGGDLYVDTRSKILPEGNPKDTKIWTTSEIQRLKPHEFEKLQEEISAAQREGRIRRDSQ